MTPGLPRAAIVLLVLALFASFIADSQNRPAAPMAYHRGGVLRFGKLTMTDADLEIVDQSSSSPFEQPP